MFRRRPVLRHPAAMVAAAERAADAGDLPAALAVAAAAVVRQAEVVALSTDEQVDDVVARIVLETTEATGRRARLPDADGRRPTALVGVPLGPELTAVLRVPARADESALDRMADVLHGVTATRVEA